jgi:predicted DNA binding CopG/RHH family protein
MKSLKIRAAEEGIPYQTLVTMVLHKYVTGQLTETR